MTNTKRRMPSQSILIAKPLLIVTATLLAAFSLLVVTPAVSQQGLTQTEGPGLYQQFGTFYLELDGKRDRSATLFHNKKNGGILILSDQISKPFQLNPQKRQVYVHNESQLIRHASGAIEFGDGAVESSIPFELVDRAPSFTIEGRKANIKVKPDLLGPHPAKTLIEHNPAYLQKQSFFKPQQQYLDNLKLVPDAVHVKIFFGTWCSVCSEIMPNILKVANELNGTNVTFEYYGVNRNYDDPESKRFNISRLPTGVIYRQGDEVGRVEGYGWRYPSMAIQNSLAGLKRQPNPNQ